MDGCFYVMLVDGSCVSVDWLIFVIGICDVLFVLLGLVECWGISVLYCLYCYGYEVSG